MTDEQEDLDGNPDKNTAHECEELVCDNQGSLFVMTRIHRKNECFIIGEVASFSDPSHTRIATIARRLEVYTREQADYVLASEHIRFVAERADFNNARFMVKEEGKNNAAQNALEADSNRGVAPVRTVRR